MGKQDEYAAKIYNQLHEMFQEDCDNHINPKELENIDNANAFVHAIATLAPGLIYNQMAEESVDILGFNHIANRLCFQFAENK